MVPPRSLKESRPSPAVPNVSTLSTDDGRCNHAPSTPVAGSTAPMRLRAHQYAPVYDVPSATPYRSLSSQPPEDHDDEDERKGHGE